MSLITDKVFYNALSSSSALVTAVGSRIYNTAIPVPDDQLLNEPVPYVIISFDQMENDGITKDDIWEGDMDRVRIGIEVAAANRESLATLTGLIRTAVKTYFSARQSTDPDYELVPLQYMLSASAVQYDSVKPCYFQTLSYQCDTNP